VFHIVGTAEAVLFVHDVFRGLKARHLIDCGATEVVA
jgi:hypothetical protein